MDEKEMKDVEFKADWDMRLLLSGKASVLQRRWAEGNYLSFLTRAPRKAS